MKKIIAKIFSPWGLVPLIMALLCNFVVYSGCNALTRNWNLHSLAIPLDKQIPLIPWTIVIYFGCYIFWIINYILIYRRSREYAYRFFVADFLSRIVCLVFFYVIRLRWYVPLQKGRGFFMMPFVFSTKSMRQQIFFHPFTALSAGFALQVL